MKNYIMIGAPVNHVRTPELLKMHLEGKGLKVGILAKHLENEELQSFMQDIKKDSTIDGLLVTMPHKEAILNYLDHLSETSLLLGSVNAVKRLNSGNLVGTQFDGLGLTKALSKAEVPLEKIKILLAGVGGAGFAIAVALSRLCQSLDVTDVQPSRALSCVTALSKLDSRKYNYIPTSAIQGRHYDLLINATPLGMNPGDPSPFNYELISKADWIADIVYDPPVTALGSLALKLNKQLISGRDMVKGQIQPIADWLLNPSIG